MQADIAIVVVAYNRPLALQRLLKSLSAADYSGYGNIPLIVSIDHSGDSTCSTVAEAFSWDLGTKEVISHSQKLGLKDHVISCGDLTEKHDGVIVLEDDLFVSPFFYQYAQQAFAFYLHDEQIAGIGLYHYRFNEFANCPFEPITDGYDNYFLQIPCSWGQMWTRKQWRDFKSFLPEETENAPGELYLPPVVWKWPIMSSWKRSFFKYIVAAGKYFTYPRIALTTNFGDVGTNYEKQEFVLQTPLLVERKQFRFSSLQNSVSIYDSFFELEQQAFNRLANNCTSITFDLNGSKPLSMIKTEYLVSAKYCTRPEKTYVAALYPYECNIVANIESDDTNSSVFSLGKTALFSNKIQMNRLDHDVQRTLPHLDYVVQAAKEEVRNTPTYKIGKSLFDLIRLPKRVYRRIRQKLLLS